VHEKDAAAPCRASVDAQTGRWLGRVAHWGSCSGTDSHQFLHKLPEVSTASVCGSGRAGPSSVGFKGIRGRGKIRPLDNKVSGEMAAPFQAGPQSARASCKQHSARFALEARRASPARPWPFERQGDRTPAGKRTLDIRFAVFDFLKPNNCTPSSRLLRGSPGLTVEPVRVPRRIRPIDAVGANFRQTWLLAPAGLGSNWR